MTNDHPGGQEPIAPDAADVEVVGEIVDQGMPVDPHELGIDLPEDREEAEDLLLREVAVAREEAGNYLEDLQRLAAEFDNYRKRALRELAQNVERASQRVIENVLPVLDTFDSAFTHEAQTPTEEKLISGMRSTYHQLLDVLQKEGLELIPALGEEFDPEVHEAVTAPGEGDGALVVTEELRRGYRLKGRIIRPALVSVDHA